MWQWKLSPAARAYFWIGVAWRLAQPPFHLGSRGIALFALAGAGDVLIAPVAGRAGDRGWTGPATLWAHLVVIAGLALAALTALDSSPTVGPPLRALAAAAMLLSRAALLIKRWVAARST